MLRYTLYIILLLFMPSLVLSQNTIEYFNSQNSGLITDSIRSIRVTANGSIWFISAYNPQGVIASGLIDTTWTTITREDIPQAVTNTNLFPYESSFAVCTSKGVYKYNNTSFEQIPEFKSYAYSSFCSSNNNGLWAGGELPFPGFGQRTVSNASIDDFVTYPIKNNHILGSDFDGNIWICSLFGDNTLYRYDGTTWNKFDHIFEFDTTPDSLLFIDDTPIMEYHSQKIWFGSRYIHPICYDGTSFKRLKTFRGLFDVDAEGNAWSIQEGKLFRISEENVTEFNLYGIIDPLLRDKFILADTVELFDGSFWICSPYPGFGLFKISQDMVYESTENRSYPVEYDTIDVENVPDSRYGDETAVYFPHHIGDIRRFQRTMKPYRSTDVQRDTYITTIIDTSVVNNTVYFESLDGTKSRCGVDSCLYTLTGSGESREFDFSNPEMDEFRSGFLYRTRTSIDVPAGNFRGYVFSEISPPIDVIGTSVVPYIGIVERNLSGDTDALYDLELVSALINGNTIEEIVRVEEIENMPPRIFNFPNPFNTSTTIQYDLPSHELVRLDVYSIHGQSISHTEMGMQQPGTHTLNFVSDNLPSGIYFLKLGAGQYQIVTRMLLMK